MRYVKEVDCRFKLYQVRRAVKELKRRETK